MLPALATAGWFVFCANAQDDLCTAASAAKSMATQTVTSTVEARPMWALGTFNGYVKGGGTATMTVTAAGKVTGKIAIPGTNYTFSAPSYSTGNTNGFTISATAKAGNTTRKLELTVTQASTPQTLGVASGQLGDDTQVTLYRDIWKEIGGAPTAFIGYYTATLPCDGTGGGYLTFTVDKAGKVKMAGKLADGTTVSMSSTLVLDGNGEKFVAVYTAPSSYMGGQFFGLAELVELGETKVGLRSLDDSFIWESNKPHVSGQYEEGFYYLPLLEGGLYNKQSSLRTYYSGKLKAGVPGDFPSLPFKLKVTGSDPEDSEASDAGYSPDGLELTVNDAGTAISAPKSPAPKKLLDDETGDFLGYNYDELVNPCGLTITFLKATGIFKGSFNVYYDFISAQNDTEYASETTWSHVVKKVSFEGALTPMREDTSDGIEGRGFCLCAAKGWYNTDLEDNYGNAIIKTYSYNESLDFLIQPEGAAVTNKPWVVPEGMVLIPAGTNKGEELFHEGQSYSLTVKAFCMDKYEVTKGLWDSVHSWAVTNGYGFDNNLHGEGPHGQGKAADHPVHTVNWCDVVKWCNARSQKEGRKPVYYTDSACTQVYKTGQVSKPYSRTSLGGYRLPTATEWEYAARGGLSAKRFPWGDTVAHSQANYRSYWEKGVPVYPYDVSETADYHPSYATGGKPYTSPAGSFAANGYGLYDMSGNVREFDGTFKTYTVQYDDKTYTYAGYERHGGCWKYGPKDLSCAFHDLSYTDETDDYTGFRTVCR